MAQVGVTQDGVRKDLLGETRRIHIWLLFLQKITRRAQNFCSTCRHALDKRHRIGSLRSIYDYKSLFWDLLTNRVIARITRSEANAGRDNDFAIRMDLWHCLARRLLESRRYFAVAAAAAALYGKRD